MPDPLLDLLASPPVPPMALEASHVLEGGQRRVRHRTWRGLSYAVAAAAAVVIAVTVTVSGSPARTTVPGASTTVAAGGVVMATFASGERLRATTSADGFRIEVDLGGGVWYPFTDLPQSDAVTVVDDPGRGGRSGVFVAGLAPASSRGQVQVLTNPAGIAVDTHTVYVAERKVYLVLAHLAGVRPTSVVTGMSWQEPDGTQRWVGTGAPLPMPSDASPRPAPTDGTGVVTVAGESFLFTLGGDGVFWQHWHPDGWSSGVQLPGAVPTDGLVTGGDGALFGYRFLVTTAKPHGITPAVAPSAGAKGWVARTVAVQPLAKPGEARWVTVLSFPLFDDGGTYQLSTVTWVDPAGTRYTARVGS